MAITIKSRTALNQIKEQVVGNWRRGKDDRSELERTWRRCMMAYLSRFDKKWVDYADAAGRSHRYLSLSYDAVETWAPQVYDAILGRDEAITMLPARQGMGIELDDKLAENMTFMLRFQMEYGKYRRTTMQAVKSLGILGNCPWWMDWKIKKAVNYEAFARAMDVWMAQATEYQQEYEAVMQDYQAISLQSVMLGQEPPPPPNFAPPPEPPKDLDIIYQGPVLRIGSIFHYVEEMFPNEPESSIRILRSFVTPGHLKKLAKPDETGYRLYENLKNVKPATSEERAGDNENDALFQMALGLSMPSGPDKIELKAQFGTFEIVGGEEDGLYENYVVVVANDSEVIRCEPSPMFDGSPLVRNARLNVPQGAVYGIGILEKALDEQDSANAIHNQTIDAVNAVIQPEYEVVRDWLADGIMKPSGPGARHFVNSPGAISLLNKNFQGLPIGFAAVEAAIARHERITGAVNTASGSNESATRTARNSNVIATKLGGAVEAVEEDFIEPMLNMAMQMNAQYATEDMAFSVTQDGKNVVKKVSPVDVRRGWLVKVAGSKYFAEKQERVQNLMMATQISQQFEAGGMPSPVRKEKLALRLFKEVLGECGDIVMSSEEYQELIVQHQAALAAAQAAAQNGAMQDGQAGGGQAAGGGGPAPDSGAQGGVQGGGA